MALWVWKHHGHKAKYASSGWQWPITAMYSMSGNLSRPLLASPAALPNKIMSSLLDKRCGLTAQMNVLAAVEKKKKKSKVVFDYSQCLSLLYSKLLELQLQHNWIPDYMLYTIFGTTTWLDPLNKIVHIQSYKLHLTFGTNVMFWGWSTSWCHILQHCMK